MKRSLLIAFSICSSVFFISCQKDGVGPAEEENPGTGNPPLPSNCKLSKITQGLPGNDTVFVLKYNAEGLLSEVTEPDWWATMNISYVAGSTRLEKVDGDKTYDLTLTYNAQNKLTSLQTYHGLTYNYQYDGNGQVNRVDEIPKAGGQFKYYVPVFNSQGDISSFSSKRVSDNSVIDTYTITYSDIPNPIGGFALLNISNWMGMMELLPGSMIVPSPSKYLVSSFTVFNGTDTYSYNITYDKDAGNKIVKAVSDMKNPDNSPRARYTWNFTYECK